MKRLSADAVSLCRDVAPDVARGPFYVVLRSDLPPEYWVRDDYDGCTIRHLDLILRPVLERSGHWRGRGPAMLLNPRTVASGASSRPRLSRCRAFEASAMGVVLHELAHIADLGPVEPDPPAAVIQIGRGLLTTDAEATNGPGAAIPWRWHEWGFIRLAIHFAYRARLLGHGLMPEDVFMATDYELSPTRWYVAALGNEPEMLLSRDLATFMATPPPPAFAELWESDVRAWMSRYFTSDELAEALAACGRRVLTPQA